MHTESGVTLLRPDQRSRRGVGEPGIQRGKLLLLLGVGVGVAKDTCSE